MKRCKEAWGVWGGRFNCSSFQRKLKHVEVAHIEDDDEKMVI